MKKEITMKKPKNKFLLLTVLVLFALACTIPWLSFSNDSGSGIQLLADALKSGDTEPTAFQPFYNTATPTNDAQPITDALVPNPGLVPPDGQVNILVLGSDFRANSGYRTDVVLLVSIFTKENKISLVSFPRDTWVEIPGLQEERINTVMGYGGLPLLVDTFEHNFAVHIDHYMMTNFYGFQAIVDTLGGVDIEASQNTADRCDLSYAHGGWCSVGPGLEHLDGEMALWYVRSRYTSNDFDRTRRAQEVLVGLGKKMMTLDAISRTPEIYDLFIDNVETDMSLSDVLEVINVVPAVINDPSRIRRYALDTTQLTPYTIPYSGAYVLLPNYDAVWQVIQEAVYTP